jgi:hypothetical protein
MSLKGEQRMLWIVEQHEEWEHLGLEQMQAFREGRGDRIRGAEPEAGVHAPAPERQGRVVKQYIAKVTGMSRAQTTRLIAQYVANGTVKVRRGTGKRYTASYTAISPCVTASTRLMWYTPSIPSPNE